MEKAKTLSHVWKQVKQMPCLSSSHREQKLNTNVPAPDCRPAWDWGRLAPCHPHGGIEGEPAVGSGLLEAPGRNEVLGKLCQRVGIRNKGWGRTLQLSSGCPQTAAHALRCCCLLSSTCAGPGPLPALRVTPSPERLTRPPPLTAWSRGSVGPALCPLPPTSARRHWPSSP